MSLQVVEYSKTSVQLMITRVSGYSYYRIFIREKADVNSGGFVDSDGTIVTTAVAGTAFPSASGYHLITVTGLSPETEYILNLQINTVNEFGDGSSAEYYYTASNAPTFVTLADTVEWAQSAVKVTFTEDDAQLSYYSEKTFSAYTTFRYYFTPTTSGAADITVSAYGSICYALTNASSFNKEDGLPTSSILDSDGSLSEYSFSLEVTAGTTYHLYVRPYTAGASGFNVITTISVPRSWSSAEYIFDTIDSEIDYTEDSAEYTVNIYEMSFSSSGKVTFNVDADGKVLVYLTKSSLFSTSTGKPTGTVLKSSTIAAYSHEFTYEVSASTTYYLFVLPNDPLDIFAQTIAMSAPVKAATGCVRICTNASTNTWKKYAVHIYTSSGWKQYIPYVYTGSVWEPVGS